jgi:tetratricopeptide (TPR) repeat protein
MIDLKSSKMLSMAMKIPFVGLATAALAVGAPVGSVVAQTQQQLDWCESKGLVKDKDMEGAPDAVLADLIIPACTAVIESGKFTGNDLAKMFNNRGNAYFAFRRDPDRAIADYDQAILLAPNDPTAYFNRAHAKARKLDRAGFDADIARFKELCGGPSMPLCFK